MAIAQWQNWLNHKSENIEQETYFIFEADSQAEIIDWLKQEDISEKEKDKFIYNLINFEDNCGGFYEYQAYLLAAKYIKQFSSSIYAEEIVEQLEEWSRGYFWCNKHKIDFSRIIAKEAKEALKTTDNQKAIAAYEKALQSSQEQKFTISTAKKLLELDSNNEIAIATIRNLLINDNDKETIFELIRLCNEYGIVTETVIEILVKLLNKVNSGDNPDFTAWISNTFYYLEKLAICNQKAINSLVRLLNKIPLDYPNENIELYELTLRVLGSIETNNSAAINTLNSLLHSDRPDKFIGMAAIALWRVNPDDTKALNLCIQLLENSIDIYYVEEVALQVLNDYLARPYLTEISASRAISIILKFARNKHYIDIDTITVLGQISTHNNIAKEALLQILDIIQDYWSRAIIANTILKFDINNQKALYVIYEVLENTENNLQVYRIAKDLLAIFPDDRIALDRLNSLLATIKDKHTRLEIAKRLALKDSSNKLAIYTLRELIYLPGSLSLCVDEKDLPLPILEQIDPSKKLAIKALEDFAKKTKDQDALIYIIKHLKRLDPENDVAQRRLNRIIAAVIDSMQTYDADDNTCLMNVGIYWRGIMSSQMLPEIITALKPYLKEQSLLVLDNHDIACSIIWDCAKQMSYKDFYRTWHMQTNN